MQITKDYCADVQLIQNWNTYKDKLGHLTSSLKFETIIHFLYAIFQGIGIAGIISAALWYATAPLAPDGFKGPIATVTIAISAVVSLMMAIPVIYIIYQKSLAALNNYYLELNLESQMLNDHIQELYVELLKLRAIFNGDNEFLNLIKTFRSYHDVEIIALSVCKVYSICKHKYYVIKWDEDDINIDESTNVLLALKFTDLLQQHYLLSLKNFRTAFARSIFKFILPTEFQNKIGSEPNTLKNIVYSLSAGITCAEVLLSIGWTVCSILIGTHAIIPISTHDWIWFAFLCITAGVLFSVVFYFNQVKQTNRDVVKTKLRKQNIHLRDLRNSVGIEFAKRLTANAMHAGFSTFNSNVTHHCYLEKRSK